MKILEISCHGVPWFVICFISIYLIPSAREFQVNLLIGLLLDVVLVALTKAVTRRNRPSVSNDMFFTHGPDKFSFPSGHASRAVFLSLLLTHTILPSIVWSRIRSRRVLCALGVLWPASPRAEHLETGSQVLKMSLMAL
ncbi:Presqualene diphosphate phosphatase, partial [Orchesella cincta]